MDENIRKLKELIDGSGNIVFFMTNAPYKRNGGQYGRYHPQTERADRQL